MAHGVYTVQTVHKMMKQRSITKTINSKVYQMRTKIMFCNRDLNVDSIGELIIWHGNEFQILTT